MSIIQYKWWSKCKPGQKDLAYIWDVCTQVHIVSSVAVCKNVFITKHFLLAEQTGGGSEASSVGNIWV